MRRSTSHACFIGALCATVLSACTNLVKPQERADVYDLGPVRSLTDPMPLALSDIKVRAPSWLARSEMQYRLEYEQPLQRRSYIQSRWVSPPAEMVERFLARAFARKTFTYDESAAASDCRLRIELDDFLQVFGTTDQSESVMFVRAELLASRGEQRLATHLITLRETAPTPDAGGGVRAHREAVARLAQELSGWLQSLVKQSTSLAARCR